MEKKLGEFKTEADKIYDKREFYRKCSAQDRSKWVDYYKAYMSVPETDNPFLANLFIPKTHEAVELLAAFLVGPNQSISASPEGTEDTAKAIVAEKLLEFQWRKVLKAREKIITWVKQGIIFGNGIMKVGWEDGNPWIEPISLPDIYFDYYQRDIQDSEMVIHRIVKSIDEVKKDKKYNSNRRKVVAEAEEEEKDTKFNAYDTATSATDNTKVEILEVWTKEEVITTAPTGAGYTILRREKNPYDFVPFIKLRFKNNPLPNRAYDIGAIAPTINIQKAFNDTINEFFDNATLINNKMWIKRRGAAINPMDLRRRPGGVITVDDIERDLKPDEVSDIKPSLLKLLEVLDTEFQQASLVINILKGVPGAKFATEVAAGQANVQQMLDIIDGNIKDALSELGQMVLEMDLKNIKETQSIKVLDNEEEWGWIEIEPKDFSGKFDVEVKPNRNIFGSKAVKQKQLLDFLGIISADEQITARYPNLKMKIYKKWLEEAGFSDAAYFFEENSRETPSQTAELPQTIPTASATPTKVNAGVGEPQEPTTFKNMATHL